MSDTVRVCCAAEGCANGLRVLEEHWPNVAASGWRCPDHYGERIGR